MWYIQVNLKRKENSVIYDDTGKPGRHYIKWNKPDTERHILYHLVYMWNLKNLKS